MFSIFCEVFLMLVCGFYFDESEMNCFYNAEAFDFYEVGIRCYYDGGIYGFCNGEICDFY